MSLLMGQVRELCKVVCRFVIAVGLLSFFRLMPNTFGSTFRSKSRQVGCAEMVVTTRNQRKYAEAADANELPPTPISYAEPASPIDELSPRTPAAAPKSKSVKPSTSKLPSQENPATTNDIVKVEKDVEAGDERKEDVEPEEGEGVSVSVSAARKPLANRKRSKPGSVRPKKIISKEGEVGGTETTAIINPTSKPKSGKSSSSKSTVKVKVEQDAEVGEKEKKEDTAKSPAPPKPKPKRRPRPKPKVVPVEQTTVVVKEENVEKADNAEPNEPSEQPIPPLPTTSAAPAKSRTVKTASSKQTAKVKNTGGDGEAEGPPRDTVDASVDVPAPSRKPFNRGRRSKLCATRTGKKEVVHKDEAIDPEDLRGFEHVERYVTPPGVRLPKFWDSEDEVSEDENCDNFRRIMCGFGTNCRIHEVIRPASEIVRRLKELQTTFGSSRTLPLFQREGYVKKSREPAAEGEISHPDDECMPTTSRSRLNVPILWHNDPSFFEYVNNLPSHPS